MTNHEKIIELNKIWYSLIGGDHHKDRDCHFRICTHYMYGDLVEFEVEHHGYIMGDREAEFKTLEEAEEYLINDVFKKGILEEIDLYIEHYGDLEWDQHGQYNLEQLEDLKKKVIEIVPD